MKNTTFEIMKKEIMEVHEYFIDKVVIRFTIMLLMACVASTNLMAAFLMCVLGLKWLFETLEDNYEEEIIIEIEEA